MIRRTCNAIALFALSLATPALFAETKKVDLPVVKVALYSSGVGFFEHRGPVSGNVETDLTFDAQAVNDVLKSLVISDPEATSPSVMYPSSDTLAKTLRSLSVDLSGNPGIAEILSSLRGQEISVSVPEPVAGRILGVENRVVPPVNESSGIPASEAYLSLLTKEGIRAFRISEIATFAFADRKVTEDLARALDLIQTSKGDETRVLRVSLPGKGPREVSLGYVIPAPVWKVSYRLDLAGDKPFLQGWAIVDNAGDMDWNGVELSLVTGRPVSFVQNLYPPLNLPRPVLPLSIAGIAEAATYESGFGALPSSASMAEESMADYDGYAESPAPMRALAKAAAPSMEAKRESVSSGVVETAVARSAGEQFEFTVKKPVTLPRQQSAMIPLVEAAVKTEKVSVLSGDKAASGGPVHPMLCAELTNTTGMKLPAGPITVFDDGAYAGDALVEFFPENDKRLVAYGEDLSVTGILSSSSSQEVISVRIARGAMTIARRTTYAREYAIKNASAKGRKVIVEHPFIAGATLTRPAKAEEKTDRLYRFAVTVGAGAETKLTVLEQSPSEETVALAKLGIESLLYYRSSGDLPAKARAAFEKAIDFKNRADEAQKALGLLETQKRDKVSEQDRVRKNLEAAGNETQQGKEYLRRLSACDADIDALSAKIDLARKALDEAKTAFEAYLANLTVD